MHQGLRGGQLAGMHAQEGGDLAASSPAPIVPFKAEQVFEQAAIDAIAAYVEATGIERYYTWTVPPGYPEAKMDEHLQLFAEEVMPAFR